MVTLEMAEHIFGTSPPPFISIDGTETTMVSLVLVDAKNDLEDLTLRTVIVLARLVPSHTAGQGLDRYIICEDGWQEVDRFWIASVGEAACLDELDIWRIFGGRTGPLAEAQPRVRVCGHSAAIRWVVR